MSNKSIIGVGAAILVAGGAYYFLQDSKSGDLSNKEFADAYIAYTLHAAEEQGFSGIDLALEDVHYNRTTDFVSFGKMTYGFDNLQVPAELEDFAASLKGVSIVATDVETRGNHTYGLITGALSDIEAYNQMTTASTSIKDIRLELSDASPLKAQMPIYTGLLGLEDLPALQNITAYFEREDGIDRIESSFTLEHFFTMSMDLDMTTIPGELLMPENLEGGTDALEAYIKNDLRLGAFNIVLKDLGFVERSLNIASAVQGVPVANLKDAYTSLAAAQLSNNPDIPESLRAQMVQYLEALLMGGKTIKLGLNTPEPILINDFETLIGSNPEAISFSVE